MGKDRLDAKIESNHPISGYIGFAPTGQIHLGYLLPCMKIRDLTLAGCRVAIMLADIHAMLDERKTPAHLVSARTEYYQVVLTKILEVLGCDLGLIKFVRGSEFQLTADYTVDVWELASRVTINAAKKAGTEVVKQTKDPKLGSALYPLMQAVDENHIGAVAFDCQVDFELGGLDQRKIFCFSYDWDKKDPLGTISYLMNPIVSLAKTGKMSASDIHGKINFTDDESMIQQKIKKAFCADKDADCGLMKLMQCVFFSLSDTIILSNNDVDLTYTSYNQFENDFKAGVFGAVDLKRKISDLICDLIMPIREFLLTPKMLELVTNAYP
jgi:tyrosyl-tRNA synthetase